MHRDATLGGALRWISPALALTSFAFGQAVPTSSAALRLQSVWRHVGNSLVALDLAGLATGPVDRVWYTDGGDRLLVRSSVADAQGQVFETTDFETWHSARAVAPPIENSSTETQPERGTLQFRRPSTPSPRVYAFGRFVYRSDDGGKHWENLTSYKGTSIIGEGVRDLAISPSDEDEITVAMSVGVFRTLDAGLTWHGLNEGLQNLPGAKLRAVPTAGAGAQIELPSGLVLEWQPGEREAWRPARNQSTDAELRKNLSERLGSTITATAVGGNFVYAGTAAGRINTSSADVPDGGFTLQIRDAGAVQSFWVNDADPRNALAVINPGGAGTQSRVVGTFNGGIRWDDLTANLAETGIHGVTADPNSNPALPSAVYIATDHGVFWARFNLGAMSGQPVWTLVQGLPAARIADVRLDTESVQLWADLEGLGLYATLAPHRMDDPKVVSASDRIARATAPGALLTIAGAKANSVRVNSSATPGGMQIPLLDASETESQVQVPFDATGSSLTLSAVTQNSTTQNDSAQFPPLRLQPTSPAISVLDDGTPLLLDADRGVLLDGSNPVRSHMRVQILATGLGKVRPDWPAGTPAPLQNSPQVVAPVTAYLDREPLAVKRAIYAPGMIGVYLVEVEIPVLINQGIAELHIEAGGQASNTVRIFILRN
ncbi:MAG: hypothetical protein ABI824_08730 [Acidobacteriota bacterium]